MTQTAEDRFQKEDTIASIRLRVRHKDAYEEWEHQTRRDAFVSADLSVCHVGLRYLMTADLRTP